MNQSCRVCGEVAAGYHFGAFTCEGCKSFFGRTYNNRSSIGECKNNNSCVINKKNRTSCKSCRLKKCFSVGMSKSGSRYGRRSNWFKIHCLLQDQQQTNAQHQQQLHQECPLDLQQSVHHQAQLHQATSLPSACAAALDLQQQQQQQQHQQHLNSHHPSTSPLGSSCPLELSVSQQQQQQPAQQQQHQQHVQQNVSSAASSASSSAVSSTSSAAALAALYMFSQQQQAAQQQAAAAQQQVQQQQLENLNQLAGLQGGLQGVDMSALMTAAAAFAAAIQMYDRR